ncbi:MAG: MnmC family methyltransferase [Planctomycetota bacterium]
MEHGFVAVETADGSLTLRHPVHGETMHSRAGARTQARERYALACILGRVLPGKRRLLDIGTGLAFNLAAAHERHRALTPGEPLEAVSLELGADVLRAGLELPPDPDPAFRAFHEPVRDALRRALTSTRGEPDSLWRGEVADDFVLELRFGDARHTLLATQGSFDAVFLDPFSPGVEGELWDPGFLAAVAARMSDGAVLATYSAATRVRAGLLAAGLAVGPAPRVGAKSEGTLAARGRVLPAFAPRVERRLRQRAAVLGASPGHSRDEVGDAQGGRGL